MSFKVTCLCVIRIQNIWELTLHSVKNYQFSLLRSASSAILTADSMGLSSLKFLYWAPKDASFLQSSGIDHSRSSKVDDFDTNRKRVWYFLLVRHSNQGPLISDMLQLFGWKLQIFPILLSCGAPLQMFYMVLRAFVVKFTTKKLWGYSPVVKTAWS